MAFGMITGQPGYRAPTQSMMGPQKKWARRAPSAPPARGALGGGGFPGGGFPTRGPAASRAPVGPTTVSVSGGGGYGGGGARSNISMPPPAPFKPQAYKDPNLGYMASQAKGLMDPDSDYYKRLSQGMQRQIGQQAAAQQRGSALMGAWSGLGGGQGGEAMMTAADIGQAGLEAQGQAEANLRLQAPALGMQGLQSTFQPQLGYHQLGEGSRQFGAGLGEGARQFGVGVGLRQQQMASQAAQQQQQMAQQIAMFNAQQQNQFNMAEAQRQHQLMMQQMARAYA